MERADGMRRIAGLGPVLLVAGVLGAQAGAQAPVQLPPGEGLKLVQAHCTACHGLDFITKQPRGRGEAFWTANVARMIDTHGADIPPGDAKAIAAYLGRSFTG